MFVQCRNPSSYHGELMNRATQKTFVGGSGSPFSGPRPLSVMAIEGAKVLLTRGNSPPYFFGIMNQNPLLGSTWALTTWCRVPPNDPSPENKEAQCPKKLKKTTPNKAGEALGRFGFFTWNDQKRVENAENRLSQRWIFWTNHPFSGANLLLISSHKSQVNSHKSLGQPHKPSFSGANLRLVSGRFLHIVTFVKNSP